MDSVCDHADNEAVSARPSDRTSSSREILPFFPARSTSSSVTTWPAYRGKTVSIDGTCVVYMRVIMQAFAVCKGR